MSGGRFGPFIGRVTAIEQKRNRNEIYPKLLPLTRQAALARAVARLLVAAVLSAATAFATLPSASIPAGAARSCCAQMMHEEGNCPPQPLHGSCCNTQACLQLFLQTGDVSLEPARIALEWAIIAATEINRSDRPAVPPPRV